MKIRVKMLALMVCATLAVLGALAVLWQAQSDGLRLVAKNEEQARRRLVERIIAMRSQSLETMVTDYTFWDDMVRFIRSPSNEWAEQNIDSALDTFDIDLAWVYRTDHAPVYAASRDKSRRPEPLPLPPAALGKLFAASHFAHFFVAGKSGLLEVYGATVHPTADSARLTPAQGYLLVARAWQDAYLADLSALAQAEVRVVPAAVGGQPPVSSIDNDGRIVLVRPLNGYDGLDAAWLSATVLSPSLQAFQKPD